eukprot:6186596-Pleurochrysis_carterae.AAC.2
MPTCFSPEQGNESAARVATSFAGNCTPITRNSQYALKASMSERHVLRLSSAGLMDSCRCATKLRAKSARYQCIQLFEYRNYITTAHKCKHKMHSAQSHNHMVEDGKKMPKDMGDAKRRSVLFYAWEVACARKARRLPFLAGCTANVKAHKDELLQTTPSIANAHRAVHQREPPAPFDNAKHNRARVALDGGKRAWSKTPGRHQTLDIASTERGL